MLCSCVERTPIEPWNVQFGENEIELKFSLKNEYQTYICYQGIHNTRNKCITVLGTTDGQERWTQYSLDTLNGLLNVTVTIQTPNVSCKTQVISVSIFTRASDYESILVSNKKYITTNNGKKLAEITGCE